jgi:hypothetical protein
LASDSGDWDGISDHFAHATLIFVLITGEMLIWRVVDGAALIAFDYFLSKSEANLGIQT